VRVPTPPAPGPRYDALARAVEILMGLVTAGVSIVVLANPLVSLGTLIVLLSVALGADAVRLILPSAPGKAPWSRVARELESTVGGLLRLWRVALGVVVVLLVVTVLVEPQLAQLTLLYLLAAGIVFLSFGRISRAYGPDMPSWLRISSVGTGIIALFLVIVAVTAPAIGLATLAVLLAVSMLVNAVQSVVWGLRPTDPRQVVLLKVVLFSLFYGLVLINWIDLFGKSVPGYGVWLILTYFAPFMVLLVFEGLSEWPLALSLGLLVSLANDVGYYFVGNLLFGFHQNLGPWIAGQLGFEGTQLVTIFQAGFVSINVDSWQMGLSIYLRAIVVGGVLYYWWVHPSRIVARLPATTSARPR
jgi:uncharacterized membrane protein HdeD (DUF308 family)